MEACIICRSNIVISYNAVVDIVNTGLNYRLSTHTYQSRLTFVSPHQDRGTGLHLVPCEICGLHLLLHLSSPRISRPVSVDSTEEFVWCYILILPICVAVNLDENCIKFKMFYIVTGFQVWGAQLTWWCILFKVLL